MRVPAVGPVRVPVPTCDDGGRPFRMTSPTASRGYEPVYGATGITGFDRRRGWDDGVDTGC